MSVSNTMFIIVTGIFFNYLIVYQKNKFVGNIMYILISGLVLYMGSTQTTTPTLNAMTGIGAIMLAGSIINMIYDILNK